MRNRTVKLLLIFCSIIIINASVTWISPSIDSGFFFLWRLSDLAFSGGHFSLGQFSQFPAAPAYLLILSIVSGKGVVWASYFPLLITVPYLFYVATYKKLIQNDLIALTVAFATFFYSNVKSEHFIEYHVGIALFPLIVWTGYKIFKSDQGNRINYLLIMIILYLGVKGFGPHTETWVFVFITLLVLSPLVLESVGTEIQLPNLTAIWGAMFVMLFWFNQKLYSGLLGTSFETGNPLTKLLKLWSGNSSPKSAYITVPFTAPSSRAINTAYVFLILVGFASASVLILGKLFLRKKHEWGIHQSDYIAIASVVAIVPDTLMMLTLGAFNIKFIVVLGGLVPVHFLSSDRWNIFRDSISSQSLASILAVLLVVTAAGSQVAYHTTEAPRERASWDKSTSAVSLIAETYDKPIILTDLHTMGTIRTAGARGDINPRTLQYSHYTSQRYGYVIGEREINPTFDVYLVNRETYSEPVQRGHPDWAYFEPLNQYSGLIDSNTRLHKYYSSGAYDAYLPS